MAVDARTSSFEALYAAGVTFDPDEVRREHEEHGGPWRELAPRAKPAEPVALGGEVISADGAAHGWVVVEDGTIAQLSTAKPEQVRTIDTGGVILPGLLDLHNHPEFNVFAAWEPPQVFDNRYIWRSSDLYHQLVRDPQDALLKKVKLKVETRYAEIRALVGGVTAIQGASGKDRSRSEALVRNVDLQIFGERRAQAMVDLPSSKSGRGWDQLTKVLAAIERKTIAAFYLHLCEGKASNQRMATEWQHFTDFHALTPATVVIHGTALSRDQLGDLKDGGAKLVWSPQSNLRLYDETTRAGDALALGLPVALGADWMPTGSQSLLAEMKVARRVLAEQGHPIANEALVRMVTRDAAEIAGLGDKLGTVAAGRPADLVVLERRTAGDAWENVVEADPSWVDLVMVGGDLCYGRADWMDDLGGGDAAFEHVRAWGQDVRLDTGFHAGPGDSDTDTLAAVRAALIGAFPQVGPIFA